MPTTIALQLEVLPTGKILVPGCEPTSALSSVKLSSWLANSGCSNVLVDLDAALEAIPGSWVKVGSNFGRARMIQKWFVLPETNVECPCSDISDYYNMLREIGEPQEEESDMADECGPLYDDTIFEPPPDPYQEEGTFPGDVGVLPPIPPWGAV